MRHSKFSNSGCKTLGERFPGLEGSQLTDMALYCFAVTEDRWIKPMAIDESTGGVVELTTRHPSNNCKIHGMEMAMRRMRSIDSKYNHTH